MKTKMLQVLGCLSVMALSTAPAIAETSNSDWATQYRQKPGVQNSSWNTSEKRDVKGDFGRGSDYSSQIGVDPLSIWWSETGPVFENQY